MAHIIWIIIIAVILLMFYLWTQYGALYSAVKNNPSAVHAGQSIARYATDIQSLVGAFQAAESEDGSFMSRMGAFFGALPT
jgi:ABC-type uncharacterized transport system permease subunit